jgi:hypothetical protein
MAAWPFSAAPTFASTHTQCIILLASLIQHNNSKVPCHYTRSYNRHIYTTTLTNKTNTNEKHAYMFKIYAAYITTSNTLVCRVKRFFYFIQGIYKALSTCTQVSEWLPVVCVADPSAASLSTRWQPQAARTESNYTMT